MSTDGSFAEATALTPMGEDQFGVDLDGGWSIHGKPNGGYLAAILATAAVEVSEFPDPLAVSVHYLRAPENGPAVVEVTLLRAGRGASQLRARLTQGDRACAEALLTVGTLSAEDAWWDATPPPALPPIEACQLIDRGGGGGPAPELMNRIHERLDPASLQWALGAPTGVGELRGYAALADGSDWSPLSLLVALDCYPPITFDLGTTGWVPTLELTAYLRGLPAPGPLIVRQRGGLVQSGRVDETCQVWDSRGALAGSATQLAGVRVPDSPPAGATS